MRLKVKRLKRTDKQLRKSKWVQPDADRLHLQFSVADSVLKEFVLGHGPSAILTELVQNEYDAQGTRVEVLFGEDSVAITGNGKVVGRAGWNRLSVVMGTGFVAGTNRRIEAKVNSIGSKNFGLRSLFIYGDRIYIRSGGRQTVLDLHRGTLPESLRERYSRNRPGIHIEVPYRIRTEGDMEAFNAEKEALALNQFSRDVMPMLIKLANPGSPKSLQELIVSSKRCGRRLVWKQLVSDMPSLPTQKFKIINRTITMRDSYKAEDSSKHTGKLEEIEFQKNLRVPEEFKQHRIPDYFRTTGGRIRLALSLRQKRSKIDISEPGLFYYPLGLIHAYTGTAVSVNAPFQLDDDRTRIIDPENSLWNAWLLEMATAFTFELLVSDWAKRFGHQAYLALNELIRPAITKYVDSITHRLQTESCWPTRARSRGKIKFAAANNIVIPAEENLDRFLSDERYLDDQFSEIPDTRDMISRCGAKSFTVNSLVQLRCFGEEQTAMTTELGKGEASYYYTDFPDEVRDEEKQIKFAIALDSQRRKLSKENRNDILHSATTLTDDGGLQAPSYPLWVVDLAIAEVCPVPESQRLHQSLIFSKTIRGLCKEFDGAEWARKTAQRININEVTEEEREALYRYILSIHGHLSRKTRALIRRLPVLRNHRGEWVAPCKIVSRKTAIEKRLETVLDFPHKDYAGDTDLAKALRFKQRIDVNDLVKYAQIIESHPELATNFEETLQRLNKTLTRFVVSKLCQIPFLRSSKGGVAAPADLYLRNRLNYVCLGDEVPYAHGSRVGLYKLLRCRDKPEAEDIISHLQELSVNNQKPEQPEVIYTALASALRAEGFPLDYHSQTPIIWNGSGYSSPEETLLGSRYRRVFLDAVPCISVSSTKLRDIFLSLGVCAEPRQTHWRQLLIWFGDKYKETRGPVSENERRVLRNAYRKIVRIPDDLGYDVKCFLDRNGMLYSITDIQQERLLSDDNPVMAQAIIEQSIPLSFVDTSEYGTFLFFRSAGVKSLSEVRRRKDTIIGDEDKPPRWFNGQLVLQQIHSPVFSSALLALAEHESPGSTNYVLIDSIALQKQLNAIQYICFTKEIQSIYEIGKYTIHTAEDFYVDEESTTLVRVKSRSELYGLLARVVATILANDVTHQRTLTDTIYRLLTCRSVHEIKNYLNGKGIPWQHAISTAEDWEEAEEDQSEYDFDADDIENMLAELFKSTVAKSKTGDESDSASKTKTKEPKEEEPTTKKTEPFSLPLFGDIEIKRLKPTESWIPPVPTGGGKGGSYIWTPPEPSDKEKGKVVGRRGEEIIYHDELDRVRSMGFPESRVIWVSDIDPGADYDILSVDDDGEELWIEVKSTTGKDGRFLWPKAEFEKAVEKRSRYVLWRVYEADSLKPSTKPFRDPVGILLRKGMRLDIDNFNAMIEPLQP